MLPSNQQTAAAGPLPATPNKLSLRRRHSSSKLDTPPNLDGPSRFDPSASESARRGKPIFFSSMHFSQALPQPVPSIAPDERRPEHQRGQRKSKVEALTKIDRSGAPIQLAAGPAATSFVPYTIQKSTPPPPAPHYLRNPVYRPKVVNPPFSIDSVRTKAPRHPHPRTEPRLFGLEDCPTFYPTPEEFKDPMAYIDSISQQGKKYGMCKVVPPEGWHMPFRLETETFRFKARLQRLNQLEAASRAKLNFLEQLSMYHMQQGDSKIHIPLIDRQPLDLWKLRREVNRSGGNLELDRTKGWSKITEVLGHKPSWTPHVRAAYMNIVLPFDNWAVRAKSASVSPLAKLNPGSSSSPSKPPPVFVSDTFSASPIKPGQGISRTSTASRRPTVKMRPNCMHFVSPPDKGRPPSKRASVNGDSVLADAIEVNQPGSLSTAPSATASTPTTLRINVPGFSDREGSDSELSDEDSVLSSPSIRKAPFEPEYQKGEVSQHYRPLVTVPMINHRSARYVKANTTRVKFFCATAVIEVINSDIKVVTFSPLSICRFSHLLSGSPSGLCSNQ